MSSTNRSNNRAGGKAANNSGNKSSAQHDGSKSTSAKTEKQTQEDMVQALKPDWSHSQIQSFCKKYNYDSEKINDALAQDFEDQRPGHQDQDWQEVHHKTARDKKKGEEEKSPALGSERGRGRGGFVSRGGRGGARGGSDFIPRGGARGGRGGARGGAAAAAGSDSAPSADGESTFSDRGGRGRGRGGAFLARGRGGRGAAAAGGRPFSAVESKKEETASAPAVMGAWASGKPASLQTHTQAQQKAAAAAPATSAPAAAPVETPAAVAPSSAAAAPAANTTAPAVNTSAAAPAPTTEASPAAGAAATSPAAANGAAAASQPQRRQRRNKGPATQIAGQAPVESPSNTGASTTPAAASAKPEASPSSVNFGSVGSGSFGVSVAAPETSPTQQAQQTKPQAQDPIGPSRGGARPGSAWRAKNQAPKTEASTAQSTGASATGSSQAAVSPAAESQQSTPQGFSISHTSFPTEPVEMPRALASASQGFPGVSFGFDRRLAASASSKAVAAPTVAVSTPAPSTSAFSSSLGSLPTDAYNSLQNQPATVQTQQAPQSSLNQKLGAQDQAASGKRTSAGAVGAQGAQASQATQTFGATNVGQNLYGQGSAGAAGSGVFGPQSSQSQFRSSPYGNEQYMGGYEAQDTQYNYDQYGYNQGFNAGYYQQPAQTNDNSPRGAKSARGPRAFRQQGQGAVNGQGFKKDDTQSQQQGGVQQQTDSSSPQVGPVDAPNQDNNDQVPRKRQQQQQMGGGYDSQYGQKQQGYGNAPNKPYNPNKPARASRGQTQSGGDPNLQPSQFPALGSQGFTQPPSSSSYGTTGGKGKNSPQQTGYGNNAKFNKNQGQQQPTQQPQQPQQSFMPPGPYNFPYGYYPAYPGMNMPYYPAAPQSPQFTGPAAYPRGSAPYGGYPAYGGFQPNFSGHVSPTGFEDYSGGKDYSYPQQDMMMGQGVDTQNGVTADASLGGMAQDTQGYEWQQGGQWQQPPVMDKPVKEKASTPAQPHGQAASTSASSTKASTSTQRGAPATNLPYPNYGQAVDYQGFHNPMYQGFQGGQFPEQPQQQQQQQQQQRAYNNQWST